MEHIYLCSACMKYTLENSCPQCHQTAVLARPPKYSPEDKYASYRRLARQEELEKKGFCQK